MKEFRIKFVDRGLRAFKWQGICNAAICARIQHGGSGYCANHLHKATHYRVQRNVFGLWVNVRRSARLTEREAEAVMIAAADGGDNSIKSTWRLRDDGILEQTS